MITRKLLSIAIVSLVSIIFIIPEVYSDTSVVITDKQILSAMTKNFDVLLKDAAHCDGAGTSEDDKTIGDYFSGFWSFHTSRKGKNWLEIKTIKKSSGLYLSRVMIYRKDGEENWGWGVSFNIDSSLHVKRNSFTCVGAG